MICDRLYRQPMPEISPLPDLCAIEERLNKVAQHHEEGAQAMRAIDTVMAQGHPLVMGFSSGKDSSVLVSLVFDVAVERRRLHLPVPRLLVVHSDTGVESPEVRLLADGELQKMERYGEAHGLPLTIRVGKPSLYTSWPVRVIGGRALPTFPSASRDCSSDWKVDTSNRLLNEVFADLRADRNAPQPVVMTGVRMDESTERAANIRARGELAAQIWTNDKGRLALSPILHWTSDDVFLYLGYVSAGMLESYSSFEETLEFYKAAGGSSCAVVGDMRMAENAAKEKGGCGARSGCWVCTAVGKDKSAETMIESDPARYGYMRGLNRLRNYLANTQYDWDSRNYLGRTIDADGNVTVGADVYSPSMLERLLRYTLTAQAREQLQADRLGIKPRFTIMGYRDLVAIDAQWSLYGIHPPFHALKVYFEVMGGKFEDAPITGPMPRSPVPRYGKVHVGLAWEEDRRTGDTARDRMLASGIRSPLQEMFEDSCGIGAKALSNGDTTTAWATEDSFEVDEEGAADFVECMGREYVDRYHHEETDRTHAVRTYLSMGIVSPGHASLGRWQAIAQRTQWMQRHGLVGEVQREALIAMIERQQAEARPADSVLSSPAPADSAARASEVQRAEGVLEMAPSPAGRLAWISPSGQFGLFDADGSDADDDRLVQAHRPDPFDDLSTLDVEDDLHPAVESEPLYPMPFAA